MEYSRNQTNQSSASGQNKQERITYDLFNSGHALRINRGLPFVERCLCLLLAKLWLVRFLLYSFARYACFNCRIHMYVYTFILGLCTDVAQASGLSMSRNSQYGHSWMRSAVQSRHDAERTSSNPHDELKRYMESPLEDVADVIGWWGVSDHRTVSCTITNTIVASHH
jgi:hypothetical protein